MRKLTLDKIIAAVGGMMTYGLVLLVFLVICGCGSESKQSTSQVPDKAQPEVGTKKGGPTTTEIPQGKEPLTEKTVKEGGKAARLPATLLLDEEILPPTGLGQKDITRRDEEMMKAKEPKSDPLDEVVLPAGNPGEKGITRRDLENMKKQPQPKTDPMDEVVLPPGNPGEKGITRRDIENMKKQPQPETDPMDEVVLPPGNPGEKGFTRRDIENMKKQPQPETDPMDEEVLPPAKPGEKGITRRELEQLKVAGPKTPASGPGELIPFKPRTLGKGQAK